jgi:hypothetical protein
VLKKRIWCSFLIGCFKATGWRSSLINCIQSKAVGATPFFLRRWINSLIVCIKAKLLEQRLIAYIRVKILEQLPECLY